MTTTVVHRVRNRILRFRARRGAADSAAPRDLRLHRNGSAPGAVPVSPRRRGRLPRPFPVPAPVRDRVTGGSTDGGAESAPPCGLRGAQAGRLVTRCRGLLGTASPGPGKSPGPWAPHDQALGRHGHEQRPVQAASPRGHASKVRLDGDGVNGQITADVGDSQLFRDSERQQKTTGDDRHEIRGCPGSRRT